MRMAALEAVKGAGRSLQAVVDIANLFPFGIKNVAGRPVYVVDGK